MCAVIEIIIGWICIVGLTALEAYVIRDIIRTEEDWFFPGVVLSAYIMIDVLLAAALCIMTGLVIKHI